MEYRNPNDPRQNPQYARPPMRMSYSDPQPTQTLPIIPATPTVNPSTAPVEQLYRVEFPGLTWVFLTVLTFLNAVTAGGVAWLAYSLLRFQMEMQELARQLPF